MGFSPESPRWQYSRGDVTAATAGAVKLWGQSGAAGLEEASGGKQSTEPVSLGELLSSKGAIIGVALFAAQQLSGINAVVYFSSATFAAVRLVRLQTMVKRMPEYDTKKPFQGREASEHLACIISAPIKA